MEERRTSIAVLVVSFAASSTCDFALANGNTQHDLQRPQDAGQALSGRTFKPWNAAQSAGEQSGEIAVRKLLEADSSHVIRLVAWKKADFGCRVCAGFSMTSGGQTNALNRTRIGWSRILELTRSPPSIAVAAVRPSSQRTTYVDQPAREQQKQGLGCPAVPCSAEDSSKRVPVKQAGGWLSSGTAGLCPMPSLPSPVMK
ncbi:hypothetical protein IWZ01DRAFT_134698 [Phyllosticta capitalensis]